MSSNTSEAATTAIDQESQDNQTSSAEQEAQASSTATTNQDSQIDNLSSQRQQAEQQTATARQEGDNNLPPSTEQASTEQASAGQTAQGGQSVATGQQAQSSQTQLRESGQASRSDQGIQNIADITGGTDSHRDDTARMASEPKPDVSDQDYKELLPKLLNHFHNNREELARAIGLHRSTVDRWLNGKSRPNNSTVLRMRRLAQERRIE